MVQRKSICDSVVDSVLEKIRTKELKPGDKLPNEIEMAEEYGVSRISLREALRSLAAKGLIITKHGEGSFINEYHPEMLAETLNSISLLDETPILEMLQLRKIIETEAARLCAVNASDEELNQILYYKNEREKYCRLKQTDCTMKKKYEMDKLFHMSIAKGSHNEIFIKFIETIHYTIDIHQRRTSTTQNQVENSSYYHSAIADALLAHDGDRAASSMYAHLNNVEQNFSAAMKK